jgi:3'(2'), 5'-bisphosphate nucleotidase
MAERQALLSAIKQISLNAGKAIMEIYQRDFKIVEKSDASPLTEADLAAHNVICDALKLLTPDLPILSEESAKIDWATRKSWQTYWLVDPLDGTKEFIKKNGEFTVNIALIENHQPTLSVVYAPVLEKLYFADIHIGSWLEHIGIVTPLKVTPLKVKTTPMGAKLRIVGSRSHPSPDLAQYLLQYDNYEMVSVGSSLKFCLVAEGLADIYPRLGLTSEWDTGAGQCVAEAAGAKVTKLDGSPLRYNETDSLLNEYFLVE